MKKNRIIAPLCSVLTYFSFMLFFIFSNTLAQAKSYPIRINVITKNQADYKIPENTLAAGFSALMHNDLEWYYNTLTENSAAQDKAQFAEAGIDPKKNLDLVETGDQLFLLDQIKYKDGILLHIKVVSPDGTIANGPVVFVRENGLWKQTFEYSADQDLHIYLDAAPPEEILNTEIRLFPNHWNYQWYQQMLNKKPKQQVSDLKKISLLCVLGNLKDTDGNVRSVEDIDPETVVLNYVVKPIPWRAGQKKESAVLIDKNNTNQLIPESFEIWEQQHQTRQNFKGPVMLIRFSKFEAVNSLENLDDGKTFTVSVSGKLKDNETHFRGETQIILTSSSSLTDKHDRRSPYPVVEDLFHDHWWDQME
jgi:hypothetical protein